MLPPVRLAMLQYKNVCRPSIEIMTLKEKLSPNKYGRVLTLGTMIAVGVSVYFYSRRKLKDMPVKEFEPISDMKQKSN
uniref:Uncharacterized protein n=1 Tax=Romanomermis culicivorax TaxID=13658 RepID=A0A915JTL9_ROMCU